MKISLEEFTLATFRYEPEYLDGIESWESVANGLIHTYKNEQCPELNFNFEESYQEILDGVVELLKCCYEGDEQVMLDSFRDFQEGY